MEGFLEPSLVVTIIAVVGIGMALSAPEECRDGRWFKIGVTLCCAMFVKAGLRYSLFSYFALFAMVLLAHVWKANIAWFLAHAITHAITVPSDSIAPDYRRAKIEWREGNLKEALSLAEAELNKNPTDPEGLLFVAQLLRTQGNFSKALAALERVQSSQVATPAQGYQAQKASAEIMEVMEARQRFVDQIS